MRVRFYHRVSIENEGGKRPSRQGYTMQCFVHGAGLRKHHVENQWLKNFRRPDRRVDIAVAYGCKGETRRLLDAYRSIGKRVLLLDKGAIRFRNQSKYNRIFIDDGTPLKYMMRVDRGRARSRRFMGKIGEPCFDPDGPIIYANNSQKVHDFWGLGDCNEYSRKVIDGIRAVDPKREIIYRPKRSSDSFQDIEGTTRRDREEQIEDVLEGASCLVTYASCAAINALMMGVPAICLGRNPASPVCPDTLDALTNPRFPGRKKFRRWFDNLAWCQWTCEEMANGEAWRFIEGELEATR